MVKNGGLLNLENFETCVLFGLFKGVPSGFAHVSKVIQRLVINLHMS